MGTFFMKSLWSKHIWNTMIAYYIYTMLKRCDEMPRLFSFIFILLFVYFFIKLKSIESLIFFLILLPTSFGLLVVSMQCYLPQAKNSKRQIFSKKLCTMSIGPISFKFQQSTPCKKYYTIFFVSPFFFCVNVLCLFVGLSIGVFNYQVYIFFGVWCAQYIALVIILISMRSKRNHFRLHKINAGMKMGSKGRKREKSKRTRIPREMNI